MKKWLKQGVLGLLLAATLAGGGLGTLVVFAQGETPESSDNADYLYRPIYPDQQGPNQQEAAAPPPSAAGQQGGDTQEMEPACSGGPLGVITGVIAGGLGKALECTAAWVSSWAMWISARTLWISGVLLNITITRTLDMTELVNGFPLITIGWQIMRDIANIVFIFIALWAGISIVIGIKPEQAWGYLAQMVLVALFINFSLFITQVVVDTSNIAALHFYDRIVDPEHRNDSDAGLSEAFMNAFKLQTLYNPQIASGGAGQNAGAYLGSVGQVGGAAFSFANIILIGIFGSIFMMVAAFTFFAAAILFIIRTVTLMMLMLLSPLAFVGLLLPGASGLAHEWWSKLWSQAFFAPLYMALAYVVVRAINDQKFSEFLLEKGGNTDASWAAAITGVNSGSVNIIFAFIILIALMMGCLLIAQSLGARGSESMIALGGKLKGEAMGFVGRRAIYGLHISEDNRLVKWGKQRAEAAEKAGKHSRVGTFLKDLGGKELGIRKLNEMWEKSGVPIVGGQRGLGKFLREQTTGRLSEATFGGSKSAEQAYEESEHMLSRRKNIERADIARKAAQDAARARGELHTSEQHEKDLKDVKEKGLTSVISDYEAKKSRKEETTVEEDRQYAIAKSYEGKAPGEFDSALQTAQQAVQQWTATLSKAKETISKNLARMTTEGFLEQQKDFFKIKEVMDIEMLGSDKYNALMASEHFTDAEKEEYTEARLHRIHEEQGPLEEKHRVWVKDYEEWQKKKTAHDEKAKQIEKAKGLSVATGALNSLRAQLEEMKNEKADKGLIDAKTSEVTHQETLVTQIRKDITEEEKRQGLRNASGESTLPKEPTAPSWSDSSLRKALRNVLDTRELINYYRYDREIMDFDHYIATVKQGMWNRVRESPEVDAATKERNRVKKRYYIKESLYLGSGLDVEQMQETEKENEVGAYALLSALDEKMKELGIEGYQEFIRSGGLNKFLDNRGMGRLKASIDVQLNRHHAGLNMYRQMAPNLASNEFEMMPGMLREHPMTLKYLDQGTIVPFIHRDIENTLPMAEFFIDEFKRDIEGKGEISEGNLRILKWFVNENQGQGFTQFEAIRDDLRDTFEMIKRLIGKSARAMTSAKYATKEEVFAEIERRFGRRYDPFERIRSPGDAGR